jgi:hypothetical protein
MVTVAFLRIGIYLALLAGTLLSIRRWRKPGLVVAGAAAAAGIALLAWSAAKGIWAEPGKIHYGSRAGENAFLIGFPLATIGLAVFLAGLLPPHPRWGSGSPKNVVADLLVRLAAVWILSGISGVLLFTIVTGYSK